MNALLFAALSGGGTARHNEVIDEMPVEHFRFLNNFGCFRPETSVVFWGGVKCCQWAPVILGN